MQIKYSRTHRHIITVYNGLTGSRILAIATTSQTDRQTDDRQTAHAIMRLGERNVVTFA